MRLSSNCRSAISRFFFFYLRAPSYCLHFSVGYTKQQTLNFAIYFFLLFEMNFAKGNNLFFLENCCLFTLRVHALRLLAEKYSIPLWRQMERLLKNVIYANSSKNGLYPEQLFSLAAVSVCIEVARDLDENIENFSSIRTFVFLCKACSAVGAGLSSVKSNQALIA